MSVVERIKEAARKYSGRVAITVYRLRTLQDTVERAKELGVRLIENGNKATPLPG